MGLMKNLENTELTPVCEISQGVVLSILKWNEKNYKLYLNQVDLEIKMFL